MRTIFNATGIVLLAFAVPAAWADVTGTPTLAANTALNLETGATSASGGDLLWTGSNMTPQGSAGVFNLGALGAQAFGFLTQSTLQVLAYSSSPIPAATLSVGDVFAAKTNGGHYAAVLVTAVSGTSLTLQFTTFGTSGAPTGPTVTGVANNYSFTPAGFPNSGIAPSTIFTIFGTGLADPTAKAVLQSSAAPGLPTTLNGASITVTAGSTTVTPAIYYATSTAIAAVLPAGTPIGADQITVTYNNQKSQAFPIQVVQSGMGFDTYYGTGSGLGIATDPVSGALYTYTNSIPPGTTVTLWGSGLGADPARDKMFVGSALAINSLAHVYVGGVDAPIGYQGASGYPGLNQVNVTIPTNAPTGCNVALVGVTASGLPTNFITVPIGAGVCSDPVFGITGSDLTNETSQTTVKSGSVFLSHSVSPAISGSGTQTEDLAFANFEQVTGSSYGSGSGSISNGCVLYEQAGGGGTATAAGLDAGTIMVVGPTGSATLTATPQIPGTYFAELASGFIPGTGGSFQFNGAGGKDVGSFKAMVTFPDPLLTWTNQGSDATVTRSSGVQFTWSGGAPGTFVIMSGSSSGTVNGQSVGGNFTCIAPQTALQFQVPGYITEAMPAGMGSLSISNYTNYQTFTATGLDHGIAAGFSSVSINSTYQ